MQYFNHGLNLGHSFRSPLFYLLDHPASPINASKHIYFYTQPHLLSLVAFSLLSLGLRERLLLWDFERDLDFLSSFDCERPLKAKIFNIWAHKVHKLVWDKWLEECWSQKFAFPLRPFSVTVPGGGCPQDCHGYLPTCWRPPLSFRYLPPHSSIGDEFKYTLPSFFSRPLLA